MVAGLAIANSQPGLAESLAVLELEPVEVTAQKSTQNLQDVPVSVQVINKDDLQKSGVSDLFNLGDIAPSVTGGQANRTLGARMGIRGISDYVRNPGYDASLGVYIDGVYAGRSEATSQGLMGMERVEILRGPQGTLFGKNTVAGAINMTTRKPTETFESSLNVDFGEFGTRKLGAWFGGALIPGKLLASINLGQDQTDGWIDNLTRPQDRLGSGSADSGRAFARIKFAEGAQADLAFWRYRYDGIPAFGEAITPSTLVNFAPGPRTTATNSPAQETVSKDGGSLTFDVDLSNGMHVTSITAAQNAKNFYQNDDDMSPLELIVVPGTENTTGQVSQEIRLMSAKDKDKDWLLGFFYMSQDNGLNSSVVSGSAFPVAPLRGRRTTSEGQLDSTVLALFAHGNAMLTNALQLTGGVRFSREEKDMTFSQTPIPGFASNIPQFSTGMTDTDVSPKVGVNWFCNPELMFYSFYSVGFKSGGYNMDIISAAVANPAQDLRFNKQEVESVELGWKASAWDQRLRFNGAIYRMDGQDWQVQQFVMQSNNTSVSTITNAGKVQIDGVEIDAQTRLPYGLSLKGGVAYTDAKFLEYKNGGGLGVNYDGNRLPFAPKLKSSLTIEQTLPWESLQWSWSVGFTHTDEQFSNSNNLPVTRIAPYDLLNARIAVSGGERLAWSLALWGQNLTNHEYVTFQGVQALNQARAIYGAPRTIGLSLNLDF